MDPSRIDEALNARPGVCSRYGRDRIICQVPGSPAAVGGGGGTSETFEARVKRELESEIESRATAAGFDRTPTGVQMDIDAKGYTNWKVTKQPYSPDYWRIAGQIISDGAAAGRFVPRDSKAHRIVLTLGAQRPTPTPTVTESESGTACPDIPGQRSEGPGEQGEQGSTPTPFEQPTPSPSPELTPMPTPTPTTIVGNIEDNSVTWSAWCEEYKRLLKEIVFDPLGKEYLGQDMLFRANFQIAFYNPQFNDGRILKKQMAKQSGAIVSTPTGMIVVIPRPAFQYWTAKARPNDEARYERFTSRVTSLLTLLAASMPAFPKPSQISFFSRPVAINLNDPKLEPTDAGIRYGTCDSFLDDLESSPTTQRAPAR
jgi:hypothetical protein